VPNHGTGKEKMNNSNKKSPTLASLLAWGKTLRNSCSEYEEHHYCFFICCKVKRGLSQIVGQTPTFSLFFEKTPEQSRPACSSYVHSNEK
jgi:hypothetical protein